MSLIAAPSGENLGIIRGGRFRHGSVADGSNKLIENITSREKAKSKSLDEEI